MSNKSTEAIDWSNMDREATQSGNSLAPMVETNKKSCQKCLQVALGMLEAKLQAAPAAEAPALAETQLSSPIDQETLHPVPISSKCPSSTLASMQKIKKAKTAKAPGSSLDQKCWLLHAL
ncbi:hypothetical protein EV424DRAFT_1537417 [Suillus variegatus]|nr:hypothetical protein EV424DRAFT_1537417 [Suillus variegatus]